MFVKLHCYGTPVWVNAAHIVTVALYNNVTQIHLIYDNVLYVDEDTKTVTRKVKNACKR